MRIIWILALCGTALAEQGFQPATVPPDKAVIYIYKPKTYGKDVYRVQANGETLTDLKRGGYFVYVSSPGTVDIVAPKRPRIGNVIGWAAREGVNKALFVESGKVYYLRKSGTFKESLEEVSADVALKELAKCKPLPPLKPRGDK